MQLLVQALGYIAVTAYITKPNAPTTTTQQTGTAALSGSSVSYEKLAGMSGVLLLLCQLAVDVPKPSAPSVFAGFSPKDKTPKEIADIAVKCTSLSSWSVNLASLGFALDKLQSVAWVLTDGMLCMCKVTAPSAPALAPAASAQPVATSTAAPGVVVLKPYHDATFKQWEHQLSQHILGSSKSQPFGGCGEKELQLEMEAAAKQAQQAQQTQQPQLSPWLRIPQSRDMLADLGINQGDLDAKLRAVGLPMWLIEAKADQVTWNDLPNPIFHKSRLMLSWMHGVRPQQLLPIILPRCTYMSPGINLAHWPGPQRP